MGGDEIVAPGAIGVTSRRRQVVMRAGDEVSCDLCAARAYASCLSLVEVRARGHARAAGDRQKFYVIKFHNLLVEMLVIYYQE